MHRNLIKINVLQQQIKKEEIEAEEEEYLMESGSFNRLKQIKNLILR